MGLLSEGKPLSWPETKKNASHVKKVGIQQFLALYHRLKDRKGDVLKWGDEVKRLYVASYQVQLLGVSRSRIRSKQTPSPYVRPSGFVL